MGCEDVLIAWLYVCIFASEICYDVEHWALVVGQSFELVLRPWQKNQLDVWAHNDYSFYIV